MIRNILRKDYSSDPVEVKSEYTREGVIIDTITYEPEINKSMYSIPYDQYRDMIDIISDNEVRSRMANNLAENLLKGISISKVKDRGRMTFEARVSLLVEKNTLALKSKVRDLDYSNGNLKANLDISNNKIVDLKTDLNISNNKIVKLKEDLDILFNSSLYELVRMWFYMKFKRFMK